MTIYKVKKKIMEDANPSPVGTVRVTQWQVLGFLGTAEDADRFRRSYSLEYPNAVLKVQEVEVSGGNTESEKEKIVETSIEA